MNVYGFQRVVDPNPGFKSKYCYFHPFFCRDLPDRLAKMDRRKPPSRTKKTTVRKTTGIISPSLSMSLHHQQQRPSYSPFQSENNGGMINEEFHSSITPSIFNESIIDSNDLLSNSCESSDMDLLDSLFLLEETYGENFSSSSSSSSSSPSSFPSFDSTTTVNGNHVI